MKENKITMHFVWIAQNILESYFDFGVKYGSFMF